MRGAPSLAPGAACSHWHSRCGLMQHQQCRKLFLCPAPCTAGRPESGRGPSHYLNIFPVAVGLQGLREAVLEERWRGFSEAHGVTRGLWYNGHFNCSEQRKISCSYQLFWRKETGKRDKEKKAYFCLFLSFQKGLLHLKMWCIRGSTITFSANYPTVCTALLPARLKRCDGLAPGKQASSLNSL